MNIRPGQKEIRAIGVRSIFYGVGWLVHDWVLADFPPEETAGGVDCSPGLAAGCLWRIRESYMRGLEPQKKMTAFPAGASMFNKLPAHSNYHSLAEHIGSQHRGHPVTSSEWRVASGEWQLA